MKLFGKSLGKLFAVLFLAAFVFGAFNLLAPKKAQATHCCATAGNFCVTYCPDVVANGRDCTGGGPTSNEMAFYSTTNYGGFCVAFTVPNGSPDLDPSGWHNWLSIGSFKKGSGLSGWIGVRVWQGANYTGATADVRADAPDMTGMDIRSFSAKNFHFQL